MRGRMARERGRVAVRVRGALPPLAVLGTYTLIALAMAWPLPRHFATHVAAGGDALLFLWDLWWFRWAAEAGISPFRTPLLYHPHGVSTAFTTLVPLLSALAVPLQWAGVGLIACYNLLLLLSSILGAWAMWVLARYLTGSPAAAFVAGMVYGWAPYHSAHALGSHLNLASHQWLPLYILALLRLVDATWPEGWAVGAGGVGPGGRAWRWAGAAGLAAAATALTELTYAAVLAVWTALYLSYRGWPLARRRAWRTLVRALGPLAAAGGLALLLAAPLLIPMARALRGANYLVHGPAETIFYSADLLAYALPSELHPLLGPRVAALAAGLGGNPAERIVTLGYTVPLLCLIALVAGRARRAVRFWGWSAAVFAVLSLGPLLHVNGRDTWTAFGGRVLLPYALLYDLPGFAIMRAPGRFAILVALSAAVLAAYALAPLREGRGHLRRTGGLAVLPLAALIAAEYWPPPSPIELGRSAAATLMRGDPAPGAVLNLPLIQAVDYLWEQTQHGRPLVGGFLARQPPDPFAAHNPAVRYLDPALPAGADAFVRDGAGLRALRGAGVRYVVVHWWLVPEAEQQDLVRKLGIVFGDQQAVALPGDQAGVYVIPP